MARYRITYDNDHDETVTAANVTKDIDSDQYRFTDTNHLDVALIPADNVLSIIRQDDEAVTG
ncbi:hypothetical protein [Streptomyces sp. CC224B]|uniref:hypothetical protein n=1 Tax=Streptomyces sp. CC224B TaxID=3044571 RepID=UPI0024A80992|nr:hypothetical protein [Streptomyces sp. CC224B]